MTQPLTLSSMEEKKNQLTTKLLRLKDRRDDLYAYLIDLAKKLPPLDPGLKKDEHLVPGCVSRVWLICQHKDGLVHFQADADAFIPKGIISLILYLVDKQRPEDILSFDFSFLDQLGLGASLSFNRRNSVANFIQKIKTML